jgi:hypothetical protein
MSVSVTAAQPCATETGQQTTSSEQFRAWVTSLEGQKLWGAMHLTITLDGICHTLDQVSADTYGLLISLQGTAILSAINPATIARLETRYREAAETGLCFWWEDGILTRVEGCEAFLARIGTLPFPATPFARQRSHAFSRTREKEHSRNATHYSEGGATGEPSRF